MHRYRSHTCGELRATDVGTDVRLSGWLHNRRNLGGILFIDLRDHYGIVQLVVRDESSEINDKLSSLSKETVLRVDGKVTARGEENVNPELPTGEIEVEVAQVEVLGGAEQIPFTINAEDGVNEERRLEHRFLDLRRERMHRNVMLRSKVIAAIREKMTAQGFNEMATPILSATSPEGARDFLVPSRLHPGKFYALPQAPQQFKQLLMIMRLRPLLPDRALLPRRGRARRPLARRVLPARHGDELRRAGGRLRGHRDGDDRAVPGAGRGP